MSRASVSKKKQGLDKELKRDLLRLNKRFIDEVIAKIIIDEDCPDTPDYMFQKLRERWSEYCGNN